jgi:hypothetical protein
VLDRAVPGEVFGRGLGVVPVSLGPHPPMIIIVALMLHDRLLLDRQGAERIAYRHRRSRRSHQRDEWDATAKKAVVFFLADSATVNRG